MKKTTPKFIFSALLVFGVSLSLFLYTNTEKENETSGPPKKVRSSQSPKAAPRAAIDREEFFFNALRDPSLNQIPADARAKELQLFQSIKNIGLKSAQATTYTWSEAGPNDVGGRTRALAVDARNSNTILAGGVSGGIWKSIDQGASWTLKNSPEETLSVTSICQDPRVGHQDTWYYACGEFSGGSARASGASFYGHGLFKSIDNGETWTMIMDEGKSPYKWDSWLDFVSKMKVHPINGEPYLAINAFGLKKLVNNGGTYTLVDILGGSNQHHFCDFDFDTNGNVIVVLSESGYETPTNTPGVYYINNATDAITQIDALSTTFPTKHERSLVRFAPSDANVGYVYTHKGNDEVAFHKIEIAEDNLIDRTAFLPVSANNDNGLLGKQGNYNMTLAVKPDDPNFIIAGSTSLFRSRDGFTTVPDFFDGWIGGYEASKTLSNSSYFNHHADCHITVFDPNNNNAVWSGHDGGLSYVPDITVATSQGTNVRWENKNNGYNVTQYYTVSDITKANEERYLGGTQDNGSPVFTWDGTTTGASTDVSSGDGSYCYMGANYAYVSTQNGNVMRIGYGVNDIPLSPYSPEGPYDWTVVHPSEATGQLFINPFVVDQNTENIMYYAGGEQLWINKKLEALEASQSETMDGWYAPKSLQLTGTTVSTLAISRTPANVLYYGCYADKSTPRIFRVKNSHYDEDLLVREDISVAAAASGSYPYHIAINPSNADEIIVTFSNYGVPSAFHSADGGKTYTNIDGNLAASTENPGPSFRSAAIQNWAGEKTYYISTSIGTYKTKTLNGANTVWEVIARQTLGNVVCNRVKTSDLDGKVVIATHGRGLFVGQSSSPLFINNQISNETVFLGAVNKTIDLSQVFGHDASAGIDLSLQTNSNTSVVNASLSGNSLNLDFSDDNIGVAYITLRASSGTDFIETTFSVTVKDHKDTAIDDLDEKEDNVTLSVYPNPTDGQFKIKTKNSEVVKCTIHIYNTQGRLVYNKMFNSTNELNNYSFNLSDQQSGLYIIKVTIGDQVYNEKLKIQ